VVTNVKESIIKIRVVLLMETTDCDLGSWFVEVEEENVGI